MEGTSKPFNTDNALEIQRLELALESAGIGTWEYDLQTNHVRLCRRAKALFNLAGNDIVDLEFLLDRIHENDRNDFTSEIDASLKNGVTFSTELRTIVDHTGTYRWLHCKGQSHSDPATSTSRVLGTFSDITNEVENRGRLKEQQKHSRSFQTVAQQAPMAIGLLSGPELIVELGNDKLFEVWGKSPSITGMRLVDALPEIEGQGFVELLQNVYKTGLPYAGSGYPATLFRNDQPEQVYFDFVYTPMLEENGEISGIMVMANEVTAQYNAVKELEASENKFRTLIEEIPVGISLFTGKDMIVELINQPMTQYWGKDMSVIGKPLREALPELEGQPFHDILADIYNNGTTFTSVDAPVDLEVDGKLSTYYFTYTYKPLFDELGKVYGIIDMSIDVTPQVLAKKALQESESKLRTVIASAPAAIGLFVGRDLVVELPNQSFIDIVGKGPDITGKPLREVMPELESQPFLQILDDVYTTGITYNSFGTQVNIVQHGVMSRNYYDITYSPVFDSEEKVYAILDIAIEVTERVHVEKQIRQSELQLLSLFEQSPVGIAMISKDDLTFTMANPFYGKLVGRPPQEIIGKPLIQALPEMQGQGFDKLLQQVITTGIPFISKEQPVDIIYDDVLQTIYVNLAYQPQRDLEGTITGVLVVATDLTEHVLARKKIEETQAFLRGAIELAELGTFSIDLNTGTLDYSDRLKYWFGLQKNDQLTSEKTYAAISEKDRPAVIAAVNQAIAPGSNGLFDMEYMMDAEKTGSSRILHAQGKVRYDENGKPVIMTGTVQDVTVQRKINLTLELQVQERTEELEASNEELAAINEEYIATNEELSDSNNRLNQSNVNLQQFAYVASHDLQEPLRKIQSFSNLLSVRYGDKLGDGANYLQRMQAAAQRMSAMIEDLLAFSRLTSNNEITDTVSLTKIVYEVLNDLELVITESSASITVRQLPEIQGDRMQLNQLFLNLISNALKFKKPDVNPVIEIKCETILSSDLPASLIVTRTPGAYYKIDVADNGIGFDQQYADRIFQLFQRLHGRSQYSGTGIGLAICERVAANHNGGIGVVSHPGEGAVFSIYLPVSQL
ncbi:PAS domain-containing protein [Dyadobacter sp. NIV53]|uniref:PAS domain-containing protein n=1 Tax=Dyadobacter sp. NIV53 TaxID=2861765 RepID=UPI001C8785B2|nr:PAS domain-containing protein [Dyadobacter sp. NIV53]